MRRGDSADTAPPLVIEGPDARPAEIHVSLGVYLPDRVSRVDKEYDTSAEAKRQEGMAPDRNHRGGELVACVGADWPRDLHHAAAFGSISCRLSLKIDIGFVSGGPSP